MINLVYVHIGTQLPECFLDNIYQTLLINNNVKIYLLLDDSLIETVQSSISKLNTSYMKNPNIHLPFVFVRNSLLESYLNNNTDYSLYKKALSKFNLNFRDGFWISTTKRFFYLQAAMDLFYLTNVIHVENDVILNEKLFNIYDSISEKSKIKVVKDSNERVIPSILFIPNMKELQKLTSHIAVTLNNSDVFINDMALLASFNDYSLFNIMPRVSHKYMYDGAAIGQYLDGVDVRNLPNIPQDVNSKEYKQIQFSNPSKGFVNETSIYKANTSKFYKKKCYDPDLNVDINVYLAKTVDNGNLITNMIPNIHVHSKQLYKFSSVFDLKWDDIISGDKVIELCDLVIATHQIVDFHKNIEKFISIDKIILIKDFNNINYKALNNFIQSVGKKQIKLFIYTHLLKVLFSIGFFDHLDPQYEYILYVHNSDHVFDDSYQSLVDKPYIKFIYAQNINIDYDKNNQKTQLLPIGLANSMWPHGDSIELYDVMKNTYLFNKTKNIYININPNTFGYRLNVLNKLKECNYELSSSKPYKDYLYELSEHYFCLCVRGNGIDTHRFWEALYLGVIPVIINNEDTDCNNFVKYLKSMDIPFYEIRNTDIFENKDFFDKYLYDKIISKNKTSLGNLQQLKISYYDNSKLNIFN